MLDSHVLPVPPNFCCISKYHQRRLVQSCTKRDEKACSWGFEKWMGHCKNQMHHQELIISFMCVGCRLRNVFFLHPNLMTSRTKIKWKCGKEWTSLPKQAYWTWRKHGESVPRSRKYP
jgi:hypothetical protein